MMQNPLLMATQMLSAGRDPTAVLRQAAMSDPRMAQAMRMMNGKSPQEIQQIALNMARERGIDINALARQLGVNLPR